MLVVPLGTKGTSTMLYNQKNSLLLLWDVLCWTDEEPGGILFSRQGKDWEFLFGEKNSVGIGQAIDLAGEQTIWKLQNTQPFSQTGQFGQMT